MASGGKRGSAGERVLEGRHVIGLFMLMLVFSGVFFTLGYVMGRNQNDGQVSASTHGFLTPEISPKGDAAAKSASKKGGAAAAPAAAPGPQTDAPTPPASTDWEFYHAGDSSKADDHLKPAAAPAPVPAVNKNGGAAKPVNVNAGSKPNAVTGSMGGVNLQVAALTKEADALALANTLRKKNFAAFVQPPQGDRFYHVLVGPYADQKSLDNAKKGLEVAGFKAIVKH
jgi:DedD protein